VRGDEYGTRIATAALKLALGTAVYVAIVLIAASYPFAAGMMLTFPTLNGLTLALAAPEKVGETARIMLLMPVLNCVLCAGFIFAFVRFGPDAPFSPATLLAAAAAAWLPAVVGLGRIGVAAKRELAYAWVCTLVLVALTAALFQRAPAPAALSAWWPFWQHNTARIALFIGCLALVIAATDLADSSARWLAPLGSLPVIPFFGVLTVGGADGKGLAERFEILRAMGSSVWLGAAVAVWFVYLFSRHLMRRQARGDLYWGTKIALAAAGWAACLLAIGAWSLVMQRL
jgi:hypothetical protein